MITLEKILADASKECEVPENTRKRLLENIFKKIFDFLKPKSN